MAERIANWNKDNPGQAKYSVNFLSAVDEDHQSSPSSTSAFTLNDTSPRTRIEELEREVYELRKRQVLDAVEVPRLTRQSTRQDKPPQQNAQPKPVRKSPPPTQPTPAQDKAPVKKTSPDNAKHPTPPEKRNAPTHPYAATPENTYLPPHERNFAAKPPPKDKDAAYRTQAPIQNPAIVNDVFSKTMKAPCVTLTPEEILSIAPDVRNKLREVITPKRVSNKPSQSVSFNVEDTDDDDDDYPQKEEALPFVRIEELDDDTPEQETSNALYSNSKPPPNTITAIDPFEVYLHNLSPEDIPKHFVVAKESHALRSVHMRVNFKDNIEAVADNGSSIVSMSEAVALHLCIAYDPTIYISMESANGTMDRTLGLARNVHCKIGGINLYLQFHIVSNPAYDILLGRPFDVLTHSTVRNHPDGNQTITIHDPNSGYVSTIPTFPRNRPRFALPKPVPPNRKENEVTDQDFPT